MAKNIFTIYFRAKFFMKLLPFIAFFFVATSTQAQKQVSHRTPALVDTFEMNLVASINSVMCLAQNPKKDQSFLTNELVNVSNEGEPTYNAPYPFPGFTADFSKGQIDRKKGLAYWSWHCKFIEAKKGEKTAEIEAAAARADSIISRFKAHLAVEKAHAVSFIVVLKAINESYRETDYAALVISIAKPIYQSEQQVEDSLVAVYNPLLSNPAVAKACARKFCYAFLREGFSEEKARQALQQLLPDIANKSMDAIYAILVGVPYFVKAPDITSKLTAAQNERLKEMAVQAQKDYEGYWRKLQGKSEPVIVQEKKQQAMKKQLLCDTRTQIDPMLLIKGVTVTGFINATQYFGILSGIDCKTSHVIITKPGTTKGTEPAKHVRVHFMEYALWRRHGEQYYTCSRCGGEGGEEIIRTETKTKELPFGYFDGITTTVTKTKTERVWRQCSPCKGTGLELRIDKDY